MAKPTIYIKGSDPQITLTFHDTEGNEFTPAETRITVNHPDGTSVTVSGVLTYLVEDPIPGWHEYVGWGMDADGREIVELSGFSVVDNSY